MLVDGQTEIKGAPEVGLEAKAEAVLLSNGDLLATEIKVRSKERDDDGEIEVEIEGVVRAIGATQWIIAGQTVKVDSHTEIKGSPEVGKMAKAEAILQSNGDLLATEITAKGKDRGDDEEVEVEIVGIVESIGAAQWVIAGRTVLVDGHTKIKGSPEVGKMAKAEAILQSNGDLLATEITARGKDRDEERPEVEIVGIVESIGATHWVIGGHTVLVDSQTEIKGNPEVGKAARAKAIPQSNGDLLATEIRARDGDDDEEAEMVIQGIVESIRATHWVIGGHTVLVDGHTEIKGSPEVEKMARAKAVPQSNGDFLTTEIRAREGDDGGEEPMEVEGIIRSIATTQWIIGGRTVLVNRRTEIIGKPEVGLKARARGVLLPGGDVLATKIRIGGEDQDDSRDVELPDERDDRGDRENKEDKDSRDGKDEEDDEDGKDEDGDRDDEDKDGKDAKRGARSHQTGTMKRSLRRRTRVGN